jgi:SAM-dependent methyltransferase
MLIVAEIAVSALAVVPLMIVLRRLLFGVQGLACPRYRVCPLVGLLVLGGLGVPYQGSLVLPAQVRSTAPVQQAPDSQSDRITRPTSEPYKGDLSIFEDPDRDKNLQIGRVMEILKIKEGSGVADIGAGSGWFTVRAARRVGVSGTVYAVEINPDYLKYIDERAKRDGLPNVHTVLGKEDDPLLPAQSVDAVLILKAYHEIAEPIRLLIHLRGAMRPGALLGIIDRDGKGNDHGIGSKTVIAEAGRAGFKLKHQYDFVWRDGMDYFLVFEAEPYLH